MRTDSLKVEAACRGACMILIRQQHVKFDLKGSFMPLTGNILFCCNACFCNVSEPQAGARQAVEQNKCLQHMEKLHFHQ